MNRMAFPCLLLLGILLGVAVGCGEGEVDQQAKADRVAELIREGYGRWAADDYEGAVTSANDALELDPKNTEALVLRAEAYRDSDRLDEAFVDLARAIELGEATGKAFLARALGYLLQGREQEAMTDFARSIEQATGAGEYGVAAWAHYHRGKAHASKGNWEEAMADYAAAVKLTPGEDWFVKARVSALGELGRHEEHLEELRRIGGSSGLLGEWALEERAWLLIERGRMEEALGAAKALFEYNPYDPRGCLTLSLVHFLNLEWDQAIAVLDEGIAVQPDPMTERDATPFLLSVRGMFKTGRAIYNASQEEAVGADEVAELRRRIEGMEVPPPFLIGAIEASLSGPMFEGRSPQTLAELMERTDDVPYSFIASYYLGLRMSCPSELRRELDDAMADLDRAIEMREEGDMEELSFLDYFGKFIVLLFTNEWDEAATLADRLVEMHPDTGALYLLRGMVHRLQDRFAEAAADYERAIELGELNAEWHYAKGEAHYRMGDYEQALAEAELALANDPDDALSIRLRDSALRRLHRDPGAAPE